MSFSKCGTVSPPQFNVGGNLKNSYTLDNYLLFPKSQSIITNPITEIENNDSLHNAERLIETATTELENLELDLTNYIIKTTNTDCLRKFNVSGCEDKNLIDISEKVNSYFKTSYLPSNENSYISLGIQQDNKSIQTGKIFMQYTANTKNNIAVPIKKIPSSYSQLEVQCKKPVQNKLPIPKSAPTGWTHKSVTLGDVTNIRKASEAEIAIESSSVAASETSPESRRSRDRMLPLSYSRLRKQEIPSVNIRSSLTIQHMPAINLPPGKTQSNNNRLNCAVVELKSEDFRHDPLDTVGSSNVNNTNENLFKTYINLEQAKGDTSSNDSNGKPNKLNKIVNFARQNQPIIQTYNCNTDNNNCKENKEPQPSTSMSTDFKELEAKTLECQRNTEIRLKQMKQILNPDRKVKCICEERKKVLEDQTQDLSQMSALISTMLTMLKQNNSNEKTQRDQKMVSSGIQTLESFPTIPLEFCANLNDNETNSRNYSEISLITSEFCDNDDLPPSLRAAQFVTELYERIFSNNSNSNDKPFEDPTAANPITEYDSNLPDQLQMQNNAFQSSSSGTNKRNEENCSPFLRSSLDIQIQEGDSRLSRGQAIDSSDADEKITSNSASTSESESILSRRAAPIPNTEKLQNTEFQRRLSKQMDTNDLHSIEIITQDLTSDRVSANIPDIDFDCRSAVEKITHDATTEHASSSIKYVDFDCRIMKNLIENYTCADEKLTTYEPYKPSCSGIRTNKLQSEVSSQFSSAEDAAGNAILNPRSSNVQNTRFKPQISEPIVNEKMTLDAASQCISSDVHTIHVDSRTFTGNNCFTEKKIGHDVSSNTEDIDFHCRLFKQLFANCSCVGGKISHDVVAQHFPARHQNTNFDCRTMKQLAANCNCAHQRIMTGEHSHVRSTILESKLAKLVSESQSITEENEANNGNSICLSSEVQNTNAHSKLAKICQHKGSQYVSTDVQNIDLDCRLLKQLAANCNCVGEHLTSDTVSSGNENTDFGCRLLREIIENSQYCSEEQIKNQEPSKSPSAGIRNNEFESELIKLLSSNNNSEENIADNINSHNRTTTRDVASQHTVTDMQLINLNSKLLKELAGNCNYTDEKPQCNNQREKEMHSSSGSYSSKFTSDIEEKTSSQSKSTKDCMKSTLVSNEENSIKLINNENEFLNSLLSDIDDTTDVFNANVDCDVISPKTLRTSTGSQTMFKREERSSVDSSNTSTESLQNEYLYSKKTMKGDGYSKRLALSVASDMSTQTCASLALFLDLQALASKNEAECDAEFQESIEKNSAVITNDAKTDEAITETETSTLNNIHSTSTTSTVSPNPCLPKPTDKHHKIRRFVSIINETSSEGKPSQNFYATQENLDSKIDTLSPKLADSLIDIVNIRLGKLDSASSLGTDYSNTKIILSEQSGASWTIAGTRTNSEIYNRKPLDHGQSSKAEYVMVPENKIDECSDNQLESLSSSQDSGAMSSKIEVNQTAEDEEKTELISALTSLVQSAPPKTVSKSNDYMETVEERDIKDSGCLTMASYPTSTADDEQLNSYRMPKAIAYLHNEKYKCVGTQVSKIIQTISNITKVQETKTKMSKTIDTQTNPHVSEEYHKLAGQFVLDNLESVRLNPTSRRYEQSSMRYHSHYHKRQHFIENKGVTIIDGQPSTSRRQQKHYAHREANGFPHSTNCSSYLDEEVPLSNSLSEGEIGWPCKCSCSLGEIHTCKNTQSPKESSMRDTSRPSEKKILRYELNDPRLTIKKKFMYNRNWMAYYVATASSTSSDSEREDLASDNYSQRTPHENKIQNK